MRLPGACATWMSRPSLQGWIYGVPVQVVFMCPRQNNYVQRFRALNRSQIAHSSCPGDSALTDICPHSCRGSQLHSDFAVEGN